MASSEGGDFQARIPRVLVERIDRLMESTDEGLTSRNSFIAEAVRHELVALEERAMRRSGFLSWVEEQQKSVIRR